MILFWIAKGESRRRQLAKKCGLVSESTVNHHLSFLYAKGLVEREGFNRTGLYLTPKGRDYLGKYALVRGEHIWQIVRRYDGEEDAEGNQTDFLPVSPS